MYRGECNIKHGGSKTRLYRIWKQMRIRCFCKTNPTFKYYGERGITICEEWNDFSVFREWALSHGYDDALSIDRIDNNGSYDPANCRWATKSEQAKNTRNCKFYEHDGITLTHNDWARRLHITPASLTERIERNGIDLALSAQR